MIGVCAGSFIIREELEISPFRVEFRICAYQLGKHPLRSSSSRDENAKARFAQVIPKQIHHIGFVFDNSTVSRMRPSQ
jgi:hypothetical protein